MSENTDRLAAQEQSQRRAPVMDVFVMAAWFGLVTGLVEGSSLVLLRGLGWLTWAIAQLSPSVEILWVSPVVDLMVFTLVGVVMAAAARLIRLHSWRAAHAVVFFFGFLMFSNWLMIVGRIRHRSVVVLAVGLAVVLVRWFRGRETQALAFWRKTLPWAVVAVGVAFVGIQAGGWLQEKRSVARLPAVSPGAPNVLVVVIDTLRADHVSAYGYSRATTPTLDRLAREGVLFENAFASSSWTLPAHASLLTGLYPHEHGAETDYQSLDSRHPNLAAVLQSRGYRTGAFSANTIFFTRNLGFAHGFIRFEDSFRSVGDAVSRTIFGREFQRWVPRRLGYEDLPGRKRAADVTRATLRWIDRDRQRPFLGFLNYFDTHEPYLPPQPYRSRFSKSKNPGGIINGFLSRRQPRLAPEQLQGEIDAYDGALAYVDAQISELLQGLHARGLAGSTLVVITSDHGESFGEHGLMSHANALYRQEIQVPLIFWWPGHLPAGARISTPVSNTELPATVMDLLGEENQRLFAGPSLRKLWKEPPHGVVWHWVLAELAQMPDDGTYNPASSGWLKSLVNSRWHYIVHQRFGVELYAWREDPNETRNLAGTEQGKAIVKEFAQRLGRLSENAKATEHGKFGQVN